MRVCTMLEVSAYVAGMIASRNQADLHESRTTWYSTSNAERRYTKDSHVAAYSDIKRKHLRKVSEFLAERNASAQSIDARREYAEISQRLR